MYFVVLCVVFYSKTCECSWYIKINSARHTYLHILTLGLHRYHRDIACVCNNSGAILLPQQLNHQTPANGLVTNLRSLFDHNYTSVL